MDFSERIIQLSSQIPKQLEYIKTEEATKNALVLPFINTLGYNVFDPTEVVPEFTADVGIKKGEKVDYVIMRDSEPIILFECKAANTPLRDDHGSQLYRYFSVTNARIAILTNGLSYHFFSDLDAPNRMDAKPFLVFEMLKPDASLIPELKKLSKDTLDLEEVLYSASDLKYTREIKRVLTNELLQPSEEFVKFLAAHVYSGRMTQNIREQFTEIVKKAFAQFITEKVNERLQTALTKPSQPQKEQEATTSEDTMDVIETTSEELEGFYIVKALLGLLIDVKRIAMRDTQSYCGILLDDNNRKPICRFHFNSSNVKYVTFFNAKREAERVDIESTNDLYKYADKLIAAIHAYEAI
jgi:predicted type IV restriction endonuclease